MGNNRKKQLKNKVYKPGDLVFAKVKGYSQWPARIEEIPNKNLPKGKYKVFFYGTHETYCLKPDMIWSYQEYKDVYGKEKKLRSFNEGMWEIENKPNINAGAAKRKVDKNVIKESSNGDQKQEDKSIEEKNENKRRASLNKRRRIVDSDEIEDETKKQKLVEEDDENNNIDENKSESLKEAEEEPTTKATDEHEDGEDRPKIEPQLSVQSSFSNETTNRNSSVSSTGASSSDTLNESGSRWEKMTSKERDEEILRLKRRKLEEKKRDKLKSIRIQLALLKMDREIKKSLQVDNTDENRCCLIMNDFLKFPIKQEHLFKAPEIVETIKKCRKYKNSERVRDLASACFLRIKHMFNIPNGETFTSVFDKDKEKYLIENVDELKKERQYANKLLLEVGQHKSTTDSPSSLLSPTQSNQTSKQHNSTSLLNTICNIESPLSSTSSSSASPLSTSTTTPQNTVSN